MATQLIDFESGSLTTGDSGERNDADAIKPIDPGERVQAVVMGRPPENLRARTEELRKKVEELLYRADADKWIIHGGNQIGEATGTTAFPAVLWDSPAGIFTVHENLDPSSALVDIVVEPLVGAITDLFDYHTYTFGGVSTFRFEATSGGLLQYDYQLANSLRIIWEEKTVGEMGAGVFCTAALEGNPEHILRITIRDDGSTLASHVQTALNGVIAPPISGAPINYTLVGVGTTPIVLGDIAGDEDVTLTGTYSRELHHITAVELAAFFAVPGNELLLDGDGIGIWYEELIDSDPTTRGGRRQATPTTPSDGTGIAPNTSVPSTKLFKFSTEPEKIPGCIPLCRLVECDLVFVDGTRIPQNIPKRFKAEQAALVESREVSAVMTGSPLASSLTAGTVTSQLEEVLGYLAQRTCADIDERIQEDWSFVKSDGVTTFWNQIFANSIAGGSGTSGIDLRYGSFGDFKFGPWGGVSSYGSTGQSFSGPGVSLSLGVPSTLDRIVEILYCSYTTGPSTLRRRLCVVYNASSVPRLAIYDLDTIHINDMSTILDEALTGYLPVGPSWLAVAADSCDSSVYVAFTDGAGTSRIQAFDISADPVPAITPSWGAEGIDPGVDCVLFADVIPDGQNETKGGIKVVSEDYLFVVHGERADLNGFLLLSRLDGSTVSTGVGNAPITKHLYATGAIASDGEKVYFGYTSYELPSMDMIFRAEVGYAVLPDLTVIDGNPIQLLTNQLEGEGVASYTDAQSVAALCFDGECLWALSTHRPPEVLSRLWKIQWDIAGNPYAGVFPGRIESSNVLEVPSGVIGALSDIIVREVVTTRLANMVFDGVSLWISGVQNVVTDAADDQYINYDITDLTHFLPEPYGYLRPVLLKLDVLNANLTLGKSFISESKVFDCVSFDSQKLKFTSATTFRDLMAFDGDTLWHSCSAMNNLLNTSIKGKVNGLRRAVFR